jgi:tape measure domain-containing protein
MTTVIEEFVAKLGWDVNNQGLSEFKRGVTNLRSTVRNVKRAIVITATAGAGAVALLARSFSRIEDSEAAFTPLLGSVERAKELVKQLNDTAATTPFRFQNLADAAQLLLPSMGGNIEETINRVRMLGDTAQGNAQKLESITRGYNKSILKMKVDMESLNMIMEGGGVPILQALGEVVGKTGTALTKSISAGKVSAADLTEAFRHMTREGGIYYKGMEIASRTLTGRLSTLMDNVTILNAELGSALAPELKRVTLYLTGLIQQAKEWAVANKSVIEAGFIDFVRDLTSAFKLLLSIGSFLRSFIDTLGGLGNTLKLIGIALVSIKFAPLLFGLKSVIALAPNVGAALAAAGSTAMAGWAPFALGIAAAFLLIDDIHGSLTGKDSLGGRIEKSLGLSDALHDMTEFVALLAGVNVDEFYLRLTQDGFGAALQYIFDNMDVNFKHLLDSMLSAVNGWADKALKLFLLIPDKIYQGLVSAFNAVFDELRPYVSKLGVDLPRIKQNSFSNYLSEASQPRQLTRKGVLALGPGFVSPSSANGAPVTINQTVQVESNASPERIGFVAAQSMERSLERVRKNAGR